MSLIRNQSICAAKALGVCLALMSMAVVALAQTISTTTVQGTVYLANGSPGSGTLQLSWPAFTTASNQTVTAGKIAATIGVDGFVSVNLAPNLGSSPAGLYYTAIYHMSDGTTSIEYWVVPAAAQASIAQVRSQVMPAAQAVQAVSKAYVDQAIQSVSRGSGSGTVNSGATGQIAYYNGNGTAISGMSTIPISTGGTGASTAAGALAALGGVSLAATTAQSLAGPLNASVNSQINVMSYGAKGDCSTDDHDAIMAAQTAAQALSTGNQLPAALYFPKAPGGCYLTSPVAWTGVALIGQPGGQGSNFFYGTVIKGMPGQDVFYTPDPTTTAFTWHNSWAIHDITIEADGSVAGSFPHRWPGKWFDDTVTTSGSAVISSQVGEFSCGDVGQAISLAGAGPDGSTLVTTIASVSPCWSFYTSGWQVVTLATTASASLTNVHTYVSVLGLPVTTTIGNCAIAFNMVDGKPANWVNPSQNYGSTGAEMTNVTLVGYYQASTPCGLYTQGGWAPYQFNAQNVNVQDVTYGAVEGTSELNSTYQSSGNDFQKWDHVWMDQVKYPWIGYNSGDMSITNWQLSTQAGPQFLAVGAQSYDNPSDWTVNIPEFEAIGGPTPYGMRLEGGGHTLIGTSLTGGSGMTAQINANTTRCIQCGSAGPVQVGGYDNDISLGGSDIGVGFTDVGRGNHIAGMYSASPLLGMPTAYPISLTPHKGETQIIGRQTADFLQDGNVATPYNHDDLFIWPQDFMLPASGNAYANLYIPDTASPTGAEFAFTNSIEAYGYAQFPYNGSTPFGPSRPLTVSTNLPASKATVYYMAKCPPGVTGFTFQIKTSTNAYLMSDTHTCNSTLQSYSVVVDFSGSTGQSLGFIGGTANQVLVAWIAIRPFVHDVNGFTIPGTGSTLTTGPATSTVHDCPWFADTAGTIADSGNPCGSGGGGLSGQTTGYLPKATSATGSTTSSHIDDGATTANTVTIGESANVSGVVTVNNSTAMVQSLVANNNGTGSYISPLAAYCPNLAVGGECLNVLGGVGNSANNEVRMNFHEVGAGSSSNYVYWDFYGNTFLKSTAAGNLTTHSGNTLDDGSGNMAAIGNMNIGAGNSYQVNGVSVLPLAGTTGSIGGGSLAAGACASGTVSVTGSTTAMAVAVSPVTFPGEGYVWQGYVSAAGTVTVKVCAIVAGTPTASTYNVRVIP